MIAPEFSLSVPNHNGQPNDPEDLFFGEVDQIGKVQSGNTNFNRLRGHKKWSKGRVGLTLLGFFLGPCVTALIGAGVAGGMNLRFETVMPIAVGLGALGGAILFAYWGRPWEVCTVIGEKGLARVKRRDEKTKTDVFVFADAVEMRQRQIKQYVNGVYTGTTFGYDWLDKDQQYQFRIGGVYREDTKKSIPKANEVYFGTAAEHAWLNHRLPVVLDEVERGGTVRFNVGKKKWIDIGRGWVEFGLKKTPMRMEAADLKEASLHQGVLSIKPTEGGWGSTLKVSVADIGDMKIFLSLLEKTLGIKF